MNKRINRTNNYAFIVVAFLALFYTLAMTYLTARRHQAFSSGYDLGNMTETVWQTTRGNFFTFTGRSGLISRFTAHADLILVLFAPLYQIYSSPYLLLFFQSLAIGFSAIPIFLIAKHILKQKLLPLIISIAFLLSPNTLWANTFDFHPVTLAIPLLFLSYYFLLVKKWYFFWIVVILSLLTKENVGLYIAMLGVLAFFKFKEKKVGLILFFLGASTTLLLIRLVMPLFNSGKTHWAFERYQFSGGFISSIITNLTNNNALVYYRDLLAPYGFLPILGLPWIITALPEIALNLTSSHLDMQSLVFHYQALITVSLTIGLIMSFSLLKKHSRLLISASVFLIYCSLHQFYLYSPLPLNQPLMYRVGEKELNFEKALKIIPYRATVASSSEIRPHVTNHPLSFNLPDGADAAEYVAILSDDRLLHTSNPRPYETNLVNQLKNSPDYSQIYEDKPYYLFKKN